MQLELSSVACVGHLRAGVALLQPCLELTLVPGGVWAASAAVRSGQCWALPAPAPQQSRFSQALRQGASAGAPSSASRIFLGALGRA